MALAALIMASVALFFISVPVIFVVVYICLMMLEPHRKPPPTQTT